MATKVYRSDTANKRPNPASMAEGQLAINYESGSPGLFFKDNNGVLVKVGPVHIGTTAPNSVPAIGGTEGNSKAELWLDTSLTPNELKTWNGTAWVSTLPSEIPVAKLADGAARQLLQTDAAGTGVEWTDNVDVPGTLDVTGAATFDNNVTVQGDLTVNGTQTIINTQTLDVEDKNIVLGNVDTPTDTTANGGGLTLKGATDKTLNWVDSTDSWTSSENVDIASGKSYRINGTEVLSATALGSAVQISSANIPSGTIVDDDISASAEIAVSKLADGAARQLLQTDAAGTGVEWTSNVDVPGTLDVTGATTLDTTLDVTGLISANGKVSFPLGSAAAPSLYPGSDTDTGIYSPGANQLAISSNSSERIRIGASGEIGIGGENYGTSGQILTSGGTGAAPSWTTLTVNTDKIEEDDSSAEVIDTGSDGRFIVRTEGSERLRVNSSGQVGIGTNAPNSILDVQGTATTGESLIIGTKSTSTNTNIALNFYTATSSANRARIEVNRNGAAATGDIRFYTQITGTLSEKMRIDYGGRVGIGTSSPTRVLDVESTQQVIGHFKSSSTVLGRIGFSDANTTSSSTVGIGAVADDLTLYAGATEALRITNDRVIAYNQDSPVAVNTTATLTVANLKARIITSTTASAVTMTLPTGTDTEAGFSSIYTNMTFEWSVINTGATNAVTVSAGTAHTIVGSGTVAASTSGRFATRRTGTNTFVTYRLS